MLVQPTDHVRRYLVLEWIKTSKTYLAPINACTESRSHKQGSRETRKSAPASFNDYIIRLSAFGSPGRWCISITTSPFSVAEGRVLEFLLVSESSGKVCVEGRQNVCDSAAMRDDILGSVVALEGATDVA